MSNQNKSQFNTIYLKDYKQPNYFIETVDLTFNLNPTATKVTSHCHFVKNKAISENALTLDGDHLKLLSIQLNGQELDSDKYEVDQEKLTIQSPPNEFDLTIVTEIDPKNNTELSGLYLSNNIFCTQCESHGFRRMTYFLDRPDVMAKYTTTIIAEKKTYPILLSNGNLIDRGENEETHWVKWEDPFKKPCYLFALVAGDLAMTEDHFVTRSGKKVTLQIYCEKDQISKTQHAMNAIKKSMAWDEEAFGREYDLDIYMVVAVSDFNMGAMENKGLNIFNDKYILANPDIATDTDYENIERVVGHEYFHNWTGNRITCRDWFQLSLKEGLTVFREQEFSRAIHSHDVVRIEDAALIRERQFLEDDSPMAHPVRPESYIEINNFYTVTVYEKGAEVIRMLQTILGKEGFRKGMDLYFSRYDGQAVTTDDFVKAMEDANDVDLTQFKRWYSQAGTPTISIEDEYDPKKQSLTLKIKQVTPPTPGQEKKEALHIPIAIGFLNSQGKELCVQLAQSDSSELTQVLHLKKENETFQFNQVPEKPILSLLRDFSAPVKLNSHRALNELLFLVAHDTNGFARWDAAQNAASQILLGLIQDIRENRHLSISQEFTQAYQKLLLDNDMDHALKAKILVLPSSTYLAELMPVIDVEAIYSARTFMQKELAKNLYQDFLNLFSQYQNYKQYCLDSASIAKRSLKNTCLSYLMRLSQDNIRHLCYEQSTQSNNMTDSLAALSYLSHEESFEREQALLDFYTRWQHEGLALDKWFSIQARSEIPTTLSIVNNLLKHEAFTYKNPNKVYALIGSFVMGNPIRFHDISGAGYEFLQQQILILDKMNPQLAARLMSAFTRWKKYDEQRQKLMRDQLEVIAKTKVSRDVYEIVNKSLQK